jgi:hypothetical protein
MRDVNVTPWDATSPSSSLPWPSRFRVCEGGCVCVCVCVCVRACVCVCVLVRARARSPAIRTAAQWKLRRAASPSLGGGASRTHVVNSYRSDAARLDARLREGAAACPRVRRDRPAVRLGWSRVGGVLLARLRGCPKARGQGEGVRERTALPKGKASPASFSE